MNKITKKERVQVLVEQDVERYITVDGKEFRHKEHAERHETLLKKYPKFSEGDLEWLESFMDDTDSDIEKFEKDMESKDAIILIDHSCGVNPTYETVDADLKVVKNVIKVLHRKSVGMNYNQYVCGILYSKESFCVDHEKKLDGKGFRELGDGRNLKEVLNDPAFE